MTDGTGNTEKELRNAIRRSPSDPRPRIRLCDLFMGEGRRGISLEVK